MHPDRWVRHWLAHHGLTVVHSAKGIKGRLETSETDHHVPMSMYVVRVSGEVMGERAVDGGDPSLPHSQDEHRCIHDEVEWPEPVAIDPETGEEVVEVVEGTERGGVLREEDTKEDREARMALARLLAAQRRLLPTLLSSGGGGDSAGGRAPPPPFYKTGHWAWWVFPTTLPGRSDPENTWVTAKTAKALATDPSTAPLWSKVLHRIAASCGAGGAGGAGLAAIGFNALDVGRVGYFMQYWLGGGGGGDGGDSSMCAGTLIESGVRALNERCLGNG